MNLALFLAGEGHHIAAWRRDEAPSAGAATQSLAHFVELTRLGEQGLFDLAFLADTTSVFYGKPAIWSRLPSALRLEPLTLLGALAAVTKHIGLVATASTTYYSPFHIARFFATLDQLSGGRSGWNLVTSAAPGEAANFGGGAALEHDDRYTRAEEFAEVVQGLWDTWDEGALVLDRANGHMFDSAKLHVLNHQGANFSVRGPLLVARSPQGRPVIVQAGQSGAGLHLAASYAEVVFAVQQDVDDARAFTSELKNLAATLGRPAGSLKVMPGVVPVVGRTMADAEEKFAQLQSLIHPELAVAILSDIFGQDLSGYPLDAPLPDHESLNTQQGRQKVVVDMARRENLTIGQLATKVAGTRGHRILCGSPCDIADSLERWYREGAADGFTIMPATLPDGLHDFVELVVPELQRRGLFRRQYEGLTLRENLGLPKPASRSGTGTESVTGGSPAVTLSRKPAR